MSPIEEFATWEPLLAVLWAAQADGSAPAGTVRGDIGVHSWSVPIRHSPPPPGRAALVSDHQAEWDAVQRVRVALTDSGLDYIGFSADIAGGTATLRLQKYGAAAERPLSNMDGGILKLVEGAVPAPLRKLPDPVPGAAPAPTADPALVERTLRERLPLAVGATEAEITATEERLGVALPEDLKALYRVTNTGWADDEEQALEEILTLYVRLWPLEEVRIATADARHLQWSHAASVVAAPTDPDAPVQMLVGSPGWIAFGDDAGNGHFAVDLTPGPRGHLGQVIHIAYDESVGAALFFDSVTDMILGRPSVLGNQRAERDGPRIARVNARSLPSVEAAAHPDLEVLSIGVWEGEPVSLAPVIGLPKLRTLTAYAGTLADPLQIAALTHLEYLETGPAEWRALLDADAVPKGLLAASVNRQTRGADRPDPAVVQSLNNEILTRWNRPTITETLLTGQLP